MRRKPRLHEQTQACRPTDSGRWASFVHRTPAVPSLLAAAIATAALVTGTTPALAQPAAAATAESTASRERVPQAALSSETLEAAISAAESKKGKPYKWGGTGPHSFDCSGLVQWSFRQAGVSLPRVTQDQIKAGRRFSYSNARRGDILYWSNSRGYAYHVAIYLGDGRMIDAPNSRDKVRERDVYTRNLGGAVRL